MSTPGCNEDHGRTRVMRAAARDVCESIGTRNVCCCPVDRAEQGRCAVRVGEMDGEYATWCQNAESAAKDVHPTLDRKMLKDVVAMEQVDGFDDSPELVVAR
jgi:hypothetical protein